MPQSTFFLGEISGLLGRLWLREVDIPTLEAMNSPSFRDLYESLGGQIPNSIDDQAVEELAVAYCELLIGPKGHVSPLQSVWTDNQLQSKPSASMNRFFDLVPDYQAQSNLSDHIGVQLDFAGVLLQSEEEVTAGILDAFAQTHFDWVSDFLKSVEARTASEFYLGLASVTRSLLQSINVDGE